MSEPDAEQTPEISDRDYFLYNGPIERGNVLPFIEMVAEHQNSEDAVLILVTNGGEPDAAYKIARYLQDRYERLSICLPGMCKSAGTLLATAASEVVFAPYGELGPLDIQMSKRDDLAALESGLNISEAFFSLESNARLAYSNLIADILRMSNGIISFQTASHSAAEIVTGLLAPVYGQIEPDEVGSRARAMRIGQEYAKRLNLKFQNLRPAGEAQLCQFYPSHGFVIDQREARDLFEEVRSVNEIETFLIKYLGDLARHQCNGLEIAYLNEVMQSIDAEPESQNEPSEQAVKNRLGRNLAADAGTEQKAC